MYKPKKPDSTSLKVNTAYTAEPLEKKIEKIIHNNEPISDGSAILTYTERKDGVMPQYDIRTDRWEIAVDAMDKVSKTYKAKRENKPDIGKEAKEGMAKEASDGAKTT